MIELWEQIGPEILSGDTVRLEPGCDKLAATCREKFDNFLNFRGFPHIPGEDWLISYPVSSGVNDGGSPGVRRADPQQVVAVARSWIGTPYRHQASSRGSGGGLSGPAARRVARSRAVRSRWRCPAYTPDWAEPAGREVLLDAAPSAGCLPHEGELARGDVILFRMRDGGVAKHLGICSDTGERVSFIHAYSRAWRGRKPALRAHGCAGSRRFSRFRQGDR